LYAGPNIRASAAIIVDGAVITVDMVGLFAGLALRQ
jgi:hypothetical protein